MQIAKDLKNRLKEKFDIEIYSDQDINNFLGFINHWITDDTGRADINISNENQVTPEWVESYISSVNEIVRIRKFCEKCTVNTIDNCPYEVKQRRRVRKYERENGLEEGTLFPDNLRTNNNKIARPTVLFRNNQHYFGYELCPIAPKGLDN